MVVHACDPSTWEAEAPPPPPNLPKENKEMHCSQSVWRKRE